MLAEYAALKTWRVVLPANIFSSGVSQWRKRLFSRMRPGETPNRKSGWKWIILACIFRPFVLGVSNEMDTLAAVSRSTKPDGLARVAFSPKS